MLWFICFIIAEYTKDRHVVLADRHSLMMMVSDELNLAQKAAIFAPCSDHLGVDYPSEVPRWCD